MWDSLTLLVVFALSVTCAFAQPNPWYEEGYKVNGKKAGAWTYYDSPGNKVLVYDHTLDSILYIRKDTTKSLVKQGENWDRLDTDFPARVRGSYEPLYAYLQSVITNYTKDLTRNAPNLQAKVYLGFSVDYRGKLTQVDVLNSDHAELIKRLTAALMGAPFEWLPARKGKQTFTSILALPVVFCTDCQFHLPGNMESEAFPLQCPVLPQIMIQQGAGRSGYQTDRSALVKDKRRTWTSFNGSPDEEDPGMDWSSDGQKVVFIHQNNIYEYQLDRGSTRQVTQTVFKKSNLGRASDGWLFTQHNSFGVAEIFYASGDFSDIRNLSKEIKWPEHLIWHDSPSRRIYFVGSKGNGKSLFSIALQNGEKQLVIPNTPGYPDSYLITKGGIVHLESRKEGKSVCLVDSAGHHVGLTGFRHGIDILDRSADGRSIFYSILEEEVETYYHYHLERKTTSMLPLIDAGFVFERNGSAFFARDRGAYPTKTIFYQVDLLSGDFSVLGTVNNLEFIHYLYDSPDAVMSLGGDIYQARFGTTLELVLLAKQDKWPAKQPNGNMVFFFGKKDNLPYIVDMASKRIIPVPLPPGTP
ncbi:MAG: hypothetical protein JNN04_00030 [Cyclobacteriaceae bacterium]|nr:hypothetical protein [Cyclobacteriaceae bacterium]